jgi:phosphohistidine phosphatase SixA
MTTTWRMLSLVALLTFTGVVPVTASTPEPQATPDPDLFLLVAYIGADDWLDPLPQVEPDVDLGGRTLLEAMREGGFVIYFRHAATDTAYDQDVDLESCATQRNLSQLGRDQSRDIGEGFRELGIPVGMVRSSEFCRARETAELAFGMVTLDPDLTPFTTPSPVDEGQQTEALRDMLGTQPETGTNTVIVAHQFNITEAAGIELAEGEAAVFMPVG